MLPRVNRLIYKADFENVKQNGRFISTKDFSVSYINRKDDGESRFGFIVSKKISLKAHIRNKVKRSLREIVRANLPQVKKGMDFVILAKTGIVHCLHDTLETELKKAIVNV